MKKIYYGLHLYININNLNSVIKNDENNHDNLTRTFHALNTFVSAMEYFSKNYDDAEVEKFTTSRLHFYIPVKDDNTDSAIITMLQLVSYANELVGHINGHNKYQSLINLQIGAGVDYGKFTEFLFEDPESEIKEMTTIGSPANRAAKLQSVCDNGKILISKEVFDLVPYPYRRSFFGNDKKTLQLARKYTALTAYESTIKEIDKNLGDKYNKLKEEGLAYASKIIADYSFKDITLADVRKKLDFNDITSIINTKHISEAAVLFSDIRGFTQKVDENNLSEMKQLTQNVLKMMNNEVEKRDGVHVQFQGDRESAIFNNYNDEPLDYGCRAVLCAMRMLDEIDKINKDRKDKLNIGIGCSLGEVFATRVGMRGKKVNVVMGQTVKEADDAEDNVAGVNIKSTKTEIAITSDFYNYISRFTDEYKTLKDTFTLRKENGMNYYISTTRFSEYQKKLIDNSREKNSDRAKNNQGVKPWGIIK